MPNAEAQLAEFLAKYLPAIAAQAVAARKKLQRLLPGAVELVYDNYNALVIGFSPTPKPSDAVFSIALYPKWVTLFFLKGARLADPAGLLEGKGSTVRSIRLASPADLDRAEILDLIQRAWPGAPQAKRQLLIQSVSARQRPRRPPDSPPDPPKSARPKGSGSSSRSR